MTPTLTLCLRAVGLSLIVLSGLHALFWRALGWNREVERLSPLNARIFAVHTFFIAFVLCLLGVLSLGWPELLLARSLLARLLLVGVVTFWIARLVIQRWVFDRVMDRGWMKHPLTRIGAYVLWSSYVVIYGLVLLEQLASGRG